MTVFSVGLNQDAREAGVELSVELVRGVSGDHLHPHPVPLRQSQDEAHAVAVPAVSALAAQVVVSHAVHRLAVTHQVHGRALGLVFRREGLHAKHVHTCGGRKDRCIPALPSYYS